ncbi:regulator of telomere elongation helicase 1 homolog [Rutidosis leptorrhynchoides]|uniref:regulator of telomere elongation helicase 1 homolog n=1 Tax=Rutidosis leptorrhynchoides TaxID=125765 RepID=UPI003A98D668
MPTYKIRGIDVEFPFEAYDCQIVYMEKVIQSLQDRSNALLESPTGTGKTLCLLCATLAWRKSLGEFSTGRSAVRSNSSQESKGLFSDGSSSQTEGSSLPTIVYTSRTHSQIRQVIQELKRTVYRPKMVVLGSREQLCIHPDVSKLQGKTQTNACHFLCQKRTKRYCAHYPRVTEFLKSNPCLGDEPIDIEDLVNIGKSSGPCPYYVSRELHKVVDILFAPYNYLIDPGNRKSLNIEWSNSILIFDEAHNLEGICADAASFDLPSSLLTTCITEAEKCVDLAVARRDQSNDKTYNPDNFAILRALLLKLEKRIAEVPIDSKELGFTKPGSYIFELLEELNITYDTSSMLLNTIEDAAVVLEEDAKTSDPQKTKGTICRLESIGDILKIIFKETGKDHAQYYRVHVQEVEVKSPDTFKAKKSRIFSWWCFNPGVAMEEFARKGVGSVILTSGTLSPMDSFAEELKLKFPIRLENPHVISDNQLWAGIVPVGPSGHPFNSSYRTRDSAEYKQNLGNSIVNFARIVPDGLLVFFPSYYLLNLCIDYWKNPSATSTNSSTIWERICKHKLPVVEPRQSSLFPQAIDDYMTKLRDTSITGAVFFAVCRGKVSEGLDFADTAGRAVIVTGIPFALWNDPKVRLKREYLDQQSQSQRSAGTGSKVLTGDEWYSQQASRAVNQAVGRVIRHRHDYGAIIFCDERFTKSSHQSQISLWIQPHIKCYSKFGDVVFTLTRFFRDASVNCQTKPKLTQLEESGAKSSRDGIFSLDKLNIAKFLKPLIPFTDKSCSDSSLTEVKHGSLSRQLQEVLPANRSNLSFNKQKQSSTLKHTEDKLFPCKTQLAVKKHEVVDLTSEETCNQLTAPRFIKKRKSEIDKHDNVLQRCGAFSSSMTHSSQTSFETRDTRSVQEGSSLQVKSEMNSQKTTTRVTSSETGSGISSCFPSDNKEQNGSAFLIQVREKLNVGEYKEFLQLIRALKSNTMKISLVLQSVIKLFSAQDRLPLRQRFKNYVPSKYRQLYEDYLEKTKDGAVDL